MRLNGADLLTLSACETGLGSTTGDGREVDGLATTAQLKGAKAVISSLWEVDDRLHRQIDGGFLQALAEGHGRVMKLEALRQARLDLHRGEIVP